MSIHQIDPLPNGTVVWRASCSLQPCTQVVVFKTTVAGYNGFDYLLENVNFFAGTREWYSKHGTIYLTRAEAETECHRWLDEQISFLNRERPKISQTC